MKNLQAHLPSALLLSYAVYSGFISITIAHSIILASLAGLFAYTQFLQRQDTTSKIAKDLRQFKEEWEKEKNEHEEKVGELRQQMERLQLLVAPKSVAASPSSESGKKVYKF